MCTPEPRLVLVSLLIDWKNGARTLNQSLSEVIINQSNYLITFDTQLKTALIIIIIIIVVVEYSNDASQQGRTENILRRVWPPLYGPCETLKSTAYSQLESAVCWFLLREENPQSIRENQHKLKPLIYGVGFGNRTWATLVAGERSHHCANSISRRQRQRFVIAYPKSCNNLIHVIRRTKIREIPLWGNTIANQLNKGVE